MGKVKLFPTAEYTSKQPRDPIVPRVPCTGIFLGPSKSGKTVALISAILDQYMTGGGESVFERIYIFSPSIEIDDAWKPVKGFIEQHMGVNTEREQVYFDKWDEGALRTIIQQQKKITRTTKELGFKKLYQILVVIDDFADQPELHRRTGDGAVSVTTSTAAPAARQSWSPGGPARSGSGRSATAQAPRSRRGVASGDVRKG